MFLKEQRLAFKNETPEEVKNGLWAEPSEAEIEEAIKIVQEDKKCNRELAEELVRSKVEIIKITRKAILADVLGKTDGLTNLYNKRFFNESLDKEMARTNRHKGEISLIMIEMDHFKPINDKLGHPVGDSALIILSNIIKETIRNEDTLARYGGEEFVVMLPNTGLEGLSILAERIRKNVEEKFKKELKEIIKKKHSNVNKEIEEGEIDFESAVSGTISIGTTLYRGDNEATPTNSEDLIEKADKALYFSKNHGRNQISFLTTEDGGVIASLSKERLKTYALKELIEIQEEAEEAEKKRQKKQKALKIFERENDEELIEMTKNEINQIEERLKVIRLEDRKVQEKLRKTSS